jgi:hypothetical protein
MELCQQHRYCASRLLRSSSVTLLLIAFPKAQAQTETVLYNFCSANDVCYDGTSPNRPLAVGWYGNYCRRYLNARQFRMIAGMSVMQL